MTKEEDIENYLLKKASEYKPQRSKDPDDNECLNCTMSETAHKKLKGITCGDFR